MLAKVGVRHLYSAGRGQAAFPNHAKAIKASEWLILSAFTDGLLSVENLLSKVFTHNVTEVIPITYQAPWCRLRTLNTLIFIIKLVYFSSSAK